MLSIGDFARFGSVSVRMLRHYDAVGLLRPARVDASTGYRSYEADQLARLNRVIALKGLGFSLRQVGEMLDGQVGTEELRGMLRLRRSELAARLAADAARLAEVEARLRTIESEGTMSTADVVLKRVPAVRVAQLTARAEALRPEAIGAVVGPLYERLYDELARAGVAPAGPGIAYYTPQGEGPEPAVTVHAAVRVAVAPEEAYGFEVVELPAIESAATVVHRGSMDRVMESLQRLARWIDEGGYRSAGIAREVSLSCEGGPEHWVTELQEPVVRA